MQQWRKVVRTTLREILEQAELEIAEMRRREVALQDVRTYAQQSKAILRRIAFRISVKDLRDAVDRSVLDGGYSIDCADLPPCIQLLVADNTLSEERQLELAGCLMGIYEVLLMQLVE